MEKYRSIAIHTRSTYWTSKERNDEFIVDSDDLAKEITVQCNNLDKQGYRVISVLPLDSGNFSSGSGYFQTESVVITAERVD